MEISGNDEMRGMMEGLMVQQQDNAPQTFEAEQIERLLSCPICLEVYTKPVVILPCQHNLCRKCANDCYSNRGTVMGTGGRFRCPTCRYEVVMDRHGVYGLQRNLLVENIIDMYNAADTRKASFKREEIMCEEHPDERVNIFCKTCQKPTCSLCKVFGNCTNCDVSPLGDVLQDHKNEITDGIATLVSGNDRLQAVIAQAKEVEKGTEDNANQTKTDISASFDTLFAILEERKSSLLEKVTQETQNRIESIKKDIETFGKQLEESSKLMQGSLKLLEEKNQAKFLTQSRSTVNEMTETADKLNVEAPSFDVTIMEDFKIDFANALESLKNINFTDPEKHVPAAKYRRYVKSRAEATRVPTPLPVMRVEIGPEDWNSDTDEDNIPTEASEMQHPSYQEPTSSSNLEDLLLPSGSPTSSSLASVVQRNLPPETSRGDSSRDQDHQQRCSSKCSSPLPSHHGSEAGSQVSDAGSNNTDHLLSSTLTNPYLVSRPSRRARDLLYGASASSRSRDASPTGVPTRTNYFRGYERPPPITVPDIAPPLRRTPRRYGAARSYSFFN